MGAAQVEEGPPGAEEVDRLLRSPSLISVTINSKYPNLNELTLLTKNFTQKIRGLFSYDVARSLNNTDAFF